MIYSNDMTASTECRLKEALAKPWKSPGFACPAKFNIEFIAHDLEQRLGGVPAELNPPVDLLKEAESVLINFSGDIEKLSWRVTTQPLDAVNHFLKSTRCCVLAKITVAIFRKS